MSSQRDWGLLLLLCSHVNVKFIIDYFLTSHHLHNLPHCDILQPRIESIRYGFKKIQHGLLRDCTSSAYSCQPLAKHYTYYNQTLKVGRICPFQAGETVSDKFLPKTKQVTYHGWKTFCLESPPSRVLPISYITYITRGRRLKRVSS